MSERWRGGPVNSGGGDRRRPARSARSVCRSMPCPFSWSGRRSARRQSAGVPRPDLMDPERWNRRSPATRPGRCAGRGWSVRRRSTAWSSATATPARPTRSSAMMGAARVTSDLRRARRRGSLGRSGDRHLEHLLELRRRVGAGAARRPSASIRTRSAPPIIACSGTWAPDAQRLASLQTAASRLLVRYVLVLMPCEPAHRRAGCGRSVNSGEFALSGGAPPSPLRAAHLSRLCAGRLVAIPSLQPGPRTQGDEHARDGDDGWPFLVPPRLLEQWRPRRRNDRTRRDRPGRPDGR